ncbi:Lrp/AsnC family transcriptional regulator [Actinomadura fulvescens]|uniref:Lrp/AsnC family transcriptional regulator n=1 Tax=Actinomadura fulvescens TaxID=46160 RepID=A0ABN3QRM8_9ACTN
MANRTSRPGRAYETKPFDAIDLRILTELQLNARISLAELGRRVTLSSPAVAERVQRLEDAGAITGYHATVDPRVLGFPISVLVRVRPALRELSRIPKIAEEIPEIVECHRITGDDCFYFVAHLRAIADLEPILDRFTPYARTTTSILQSSPVSRRPLPL